MTLNRFCTGNRESMFTLPFHDPLVAHLHLEAVGNSFWPQRRCGLENARARRRYSLWLIFVPRGAVSSHLIVCCGVHVKRFAASFRRRAEWRFEGEAGRSEE